jgi:hypothetical protein
MSQDFGEFATDLARSMTDSSRRGRIQTELFHIKQSFISRTRPSLSRLRDLLYKLAYIALTGIEIDFGLPEITELLSSNRYSDVRAGWFAFAALGITDGNSLRRILPLLQRQLRAFDRETIQCVAITATVGIFSPLLWELVGPELANIAVCPKSSDGVRKRAIHAVARIYETTKEPYLLSVVGPALPIFLQSPSASIRLAAATLASCVMAVQPGILLNICEIALNQLFDMFVGRPHQTELYYGTPFPWFSRLLIKILGYKTQWDATQLGKIEGVTQALFNRVGQTLAIRPATTYFIVFSEILNLFARIPIPSGTVELCALTLGRYLDSDRPYIYYFALNSLNQLVASHRSVIACVHPCRFALFKFLHHTDVATVRFAISLLFMIGDTGQAGREIARELIAVVSSSPLELRSLLCAKTSSLVHSLGDMQLFVDTTMELLMEAGDYCTDGIWRLASKVCSDNPALRAHATAAITSLFKRGMCFNHQLMKFVVYIAGDCSEEQIPHVLRFIFGRFAMHQPTAQAMMIVAVMRIATRAPAFLPSCYKFLAREAWSPDREVFTRAREFVAMLDNIPHLARKLLNRMPNGFDVSEQVNRVVEVMTEREGVSTFDFEADIVLHDDQQMMANFLYANGGFLHHDLFVSVYAELAFEAPIVRALLQFENCGIFPLSDFDVAVSEKAEFNGRVGPHHKAIAPGANTEIEIVFEILEITDALPELFVNFKCASTERSLTIAMPLHFVRIIQPLEVQTTLFQETWIRIADPSLQTAVRAKLQTSDVKAELDAGVRQSLGLPLAPVDQMCLGAIGVYRCAGREVMVAVRIVASVERKLANVLIRVTSSAGLNIAVSRFRSLSGLDTACV